MGNYINVPAQESVDKSIMNSIKKVKTEKCFEAFDDYYKNYYPRTELTLEEFDDIFSPIINNTKAVHAKLKQADDTVNMYEAFVNFTVFSNGKFDVKLRGLFGSFDVDSGGSIDLKEFMSFLSAAIYGLCKLLDIKANLEGKVGKYAM